MAKTKIKDLKDYVTLYRDDKGIAFVENGSTGNEHSCHANIDVTGSVKGMKKLGYWKPEDVIVRSRGMYYNVSSKVVSDEYDQIASEHCRCEGCMSS